MSDARSLAASIRGGGRISDFTEAPAIIDGSLNILENASSLSKAIKGGGSKTDKKPTTSSTLDLEVEAINNPNEVSLDEYITGECATRFIENNFIKLVMFQICFNRFSSMIPFVV